MSYGTEIQNSWNRESAHSQKSVFQDSGEVDRFLTMSTHFQERSGSLENGLCVTWSGFWLCPGYLWRLILVAVEQTYDQITRRLVAQRVAPGARVILSRTQAFYTHCVVHLLTTTVAWYSTWSSIVSDLHNHTNAARRLRRTMQIVLCKRPPTTYNLYRGRSCCTTHVAKATDMLSGHDCIFLIEQP